MLVVKQNELKDISKFFDEIKIIKFDEKCAKESAVIEIELLGIGRKINKVDIFIASICRLNNFTLLTLDKDFLNINNLKTKFIFD